MKHDYLETSCWYRDIITDPYQVIAEFFSFATIDFYRKRIKGMLLSIHRNKIYHKDAPGEVLFDFKMLESVINAAYLISKEKKQSPLIIGMNDLFNKNLYCGRHTNCDQWDYFPRTLSKKEYIDPYLTFKLFFKYQKLETWKQDLQTILSYALAKNSDGVELDLLSIYFHLTKLVEAAHLIDVREITHVGGFIKNRMK